MNMYRWRIVNKHVGSAFIANDFLTRNLSTLWSQEPNVQPRFYRFSSVIEHEHMHDQSMLVLYLAFSGSQQCGQFINCVCPL